MRIEIVNHILKKRRTDLPTSIILFIILRDFWTKKLQNFPLYVVGDDVAHTPL